VSLFLLFCKKLSILLVLPSLEHDPKFLHESGFLLLLLLQGDQGQGPLLLGTINLILLSYPDGIHPSMPAPRHDVPTGLEGGYLVSVVANLPATRNPQVLLHVLREGLSLPREEGGSVGV